VLFRAGENLLFLSNVNFLGHDFGGWWIGSHLDVNTTRDLCKDLTPLLGFVGPTALQVGASLAAAICWAIMNPEAGANLPEYLPSDVIVNLATLVRGSSFHTTRLEAY